MTKKLFILSLILISSFGFSQRKKTNYNNQSSQSSKSSNRTSNNATSQGNWLIEANTGTGQTGDTSFSYNEDHYWSVGAEAGYFVIKDLAIKGGIGYSEVKNSKGEFNFKLGGKYYIISKFPVGLDFTGTSSNGDTRSWIGVQGGYAWFLSKDIALEPALRYNLLASDSPGHKSFFQAKIGFALFF